MVDDNFNLKEFFSELRFKFHLWLQRSYVSKPKLTKLFFGVNPEEMSTLQLKQRAYSYVWLGWLMLVIFIFVLFGVLQQRHELLLCNSGSLLQGCYESLRGCVFLS